MGELKASARHGLTTLYCLHSGPLRCARGHQGTPRDGGGAEGCAGPPATPDAEGQLGVNLTQVLVSIVYGRWAVAS